PVVSQQRACALRAGVERRRSGAPRPRRLRAHGARPGNRAGTPTATCVGLARLRPRALRRRLPTMSHGIELPGWNSPAGPDDDATPLLGTALLIATDEYPALDPGQYDAMAQSHADGLRDEVAAIDSLPLKMQAINQRLFDEIGYTGNHDEYYDPRNSYPNEVFDRRLGNPISLAMRSEEHTSELQSRE